MSLSDLASLGSFVSGLAVLVSLIFLYFQLRQVGQQMKQAEKNQQASIRQARTARTVSIALSAASLDFADTQFNAFTGAQDITAKQVMQFRRYSHAVFSGYEDSFYQNQDGLLTHAAFAAQVNTMKGALTQPAFRVYWKSARKDYGDEFTEFMDKLVAQARDVRPPWGAAEWLSALAAEGSGAPN